MSSGSTSRYRVEGAALDIAALLGLVSVRSLASFALGGGGPLIDRAVVGLAALALVVLAAFAAWRDTILFSKHAFVASLFGLAACGLGWAMASPGDALRVATALLGAIALLTFAVYTWLPMARSSAGVLASSNASPVWELDGIHLTFGGETSPAPGQSARISLVLENCWTGPRTVVIQFQEELPRVGAELRIVRSITARLEPLEVRRAELRVQAPVDGDYCVLLDVDVRGRGGRRALHRRASEFRNKVSDTEQLAYLAVAAWIWGGGLRLRFVVPRTEPCPEPWSDQVVWTRSRAGQR